MQFCFCNFLLSSSFNEWRKLLQPHKRLYTFFCSLYAALSRGSRAVFQFYPENSMQVGLKEKIILWGIYLQVEMITTASMKAGFTGGLVVDYPNSSKVFKTLSCERDLQCFHNRPRNFSSSWWLEEPSHFQLLLERRQEQPVLEPGLLIGALFE